MTATKKKPKPIPKDHHYYTKQLQTHCTHIDACIKRDPLDTSGELATAKRDYEYWAYQAIAYIKGDQITY